MIKDIKISFVVAVYNVEKYIKECIESLIGQKSDEIEILLIDDGSTDNSGKICDEYQDDPRVRIFHWKNQGVSVARNYGIHEATGEWIYFVDGDDLVGENLIGKLGPFLDRDYEIIYTGHFERKGDKNKIVGPWYKGEKQLSPENFLVFQRWLLDKYEFNDKFAIATPWAKLYKRNFLLQSNLQFTPGVKIGQDKLFNIYVCEVAQRGIYISTPTYFYRITETSRTKRYSENIENSFEKLLFEFQKYIESRNRQDLAEAFRLRVITTFMYYIVIDFCHPDNKNAYQERRKKFQYYINQPLYADMTKRTDYKVMSWQERMLLFGIRTKAFWFLDFINKVREVLRR